MAAPFWLAAGSAGAGSSRLATNGSSATPKLSPNTFEPSQSSSETRAFPKSSRILKPRDFRKVYDEGTRMTSPSFAAFLLRAMPASSVGDGPHFGFTTPRALGKAVVRNRIRRRMREAVRLEQHLFAPGWSVVFNPRRVLAAVSFEALRKEVARVAARCKP